MPITGHSCTVVQMKDPDSYAEHGPGPSPYDFYQDTAFEYLHAHTLVGPRLSVTLDQLHGHYSRWCRAKSLTPAARPWLGRYVRRFVDQYAEKDGWHMLSKQRNNHTYYIGLALR